MVLSGCNKTPKPKGNNGNKPTKELKVKKYDFDNPPEFRKDGELQFINDSDSIIFNIDIELATTEEEHARGGRVEHRVAIVGQRIARLAGHGLLLRHQRAPLRNGEDELRFACLQVH